MTPPSVALPYSHSLSLGIFDSNREQIGARWCFPFSHVRKVNEVQIVLVPSLLVKIFFNLSEVQQYFTLTKTKNQCYIQF